MLPAQLCDWRSSSACFKIPVIYPTEKRFLLHDKTSVCLKLISPRNSHPHWSDFLRAGQNAVF
jgi:hypothetical protein